MRYGELLDLIEDFIEGVAYLTADEIKYKAYNSYQEGTIDGTQYDHVLSTLDEFCIMEEV